MAVISEEGDDIRELACYYSFVKLSLVIKKVIPVEEV